MAFEAETLTKQPEVDSAEEIHRQTQSALIFDNKHSTVSMEVRGRRKVVGEGGKKVEEREKGEGERVILL